VIYPAKCGHALCVLVNGQEYEVPVAMPAGLKLQGFMISTPQEHSIVYDPRLAAIMIS